MSGPAATASWLCADACDRQFHFHLGAGAGVGLARPRRVRTGVRAHTMPRGAMVAPDGTEDAT